LYGIVPLTYTRDHPGPLARDARDAAIMIQTMAGPDENDPRTQGLPHVPDFIRAAKPLPGRLRWPTRVGVIPNYLSGGDGAARTEMLEVLESLGATIVDVTLPDDWDTFTSNAFNNVRLPERTEPFLEYLKQDVRLFGVSLNSWIQGLFVGDENYLKGQRVKYLFLKRVLDQLFTQCDVVVQTGPVPFDMIGLPEIAFPIGFRPYTGNPALEVPIGAILGAPPFGEERLLSVVAGFQSVTDYHLRRPPDPVLSLAGALRAVPELRLTAEDVERETE
jgi:Asp-tRNA(Asn)/Glu-tRNA(Gln) amidotransferase A subunit family amidase